MRTHRIHPKMGKINGVTETYPVIILEKIK